MLPSVKEQTPKTPLVSVVIPTYNRSAMIGECLESVLGQTYPSFEVIVVDDGSTDGTEDVVRRYPSVRYVWQRNQERSAARNRGIALAQGRYVAFLDSDDLWLPDKLSDQVAYMEQHPEAGMVHSACRVMAVTGRAEQYAQRASHPPRDVFWDMLEGNPVVSATPLIRRKVLAQVGGFSDEVIPMEDFDLWLRIAYRHRVAYSSEPVAVYRVHQANTPQRYGYRTFSRVLDAVRSYVSPSERHRVNAKAAKLFLNTASRLADAGLRQAAIEMLAWGWWESLRSMPPREWLAMCAACCLPLPMKDCRRVMTALSGVKRLLGGVRHDR